MSNRSHLEYTYIYDGTFQGLLTLVFDCYCQKIVPTRVVTQDKVSINLFETYHTIETSSEKAERILQGISKNICYETLYNCYYAFLSEEEGRELFIVKYLLLGFNIGPKVESMLSIDYIITVQKLRKKTLNEAQKLKGLLRFIEIGNNLYYASLHPTHNVLETLGHHFIARLPTMQFMIHDKNRNLALVYANQNYQILDFSEFNIPQISETEKQFQSLWKTFYETIAIKERTNPHLQRQLMPKKYWKDLIEKN